MLWKEIRTRTTSSALVIITLAICCSSTAFADSDRRIVEFNVGTVDEAISVTMDLAGAEFTHTEGRVIVSKAIKDFMIPFKRLNSFLKRAGVGGEEIVNTLEIIDREEDNRASLIFRYSVGGTGGGEGNVGTSIVVAFCLDRDLLHPNSEEIFAEPMSGVTVESAGELILLGDYVIEDIRNVKAKSPVYESVVRAREDCAHFESFILFDPTDPASFNDAYFEYRSGASQRAWRISVAW